MARAGVAPPAKDEAAAETARDNDNIVSVLCGVRVREACPKNSFLSENTDGLDEERSI